MAQKSIQVSAKKAKLKPAVKMSAKPAVKSAKAELKVKTTAKAKPMGKAMAIFEKAKSLIGKTPKAVAKPTPVLGAAPVSNGKSQVKAKGGLRPELEKAKSALVKETKVAAHAPDKNFAPQSTIPSGKAPAKTLAKVAKPAKVSKKARKFSMDADPKEAASALSSKWNSLFKKAEQIESKPYNMRQLFEEKTAIVHKVLGWGYILANRNDRLEVLFKDGIKYLISNYQP